jgi:site-specific recombinase
MEVSMKTATKKKWLRELAKWLRAAAKAPAALMALSMIGNAVLGLTKSKPVFDVSTALTGAPMIALAGVAYVVFNAMATWLELREKNLKRNTKRVIIVPGWVREDDTS